MGKKFLCFVFLAAGILVVGTPYAAAQDFRNSVVKVFVNSNQPDFRKPWQSTGSQSATGSGCVISGNRILTNAHVVEDSTFIQVRKDSSPKKYTAKKIAVANDCDLAILTVDDPEFFKNVEPIPFGEMPSLQDQVTVVGFPLGGDKLSITEGVVSRIEVIHYAQSAKRLLGVQIDAAINPGNSGGAVFKDEKLVGVAMQVISHSQNIGYMIPVPIINHFLTDLSDGKYDRFPILGIEYSTTENEALRDFYHIPDKDSGIVVTAVEPFSPAEGVLKKEDVILSIDNITVAEDGTFKYRDGGRLAFVHLINQKQLGETANLKILRQGKILEKKVTFNDIHYLIQPPNFISHPSYYIYGGLVFSVLSIDLLQSWGDKWWEKAPFDFLYFLEGKGRLNEKRKKEVVVLLDILPDDRNIGYLHFSNQVISAVNGKEFSSFREFVQLVEKTTGDYVIFQTLDGVNIIISTKNIKDVTDKILERNNILRRYSEDVRDLI